MKELEYISNALKDMGEEFQSINAVRKQGAKDASFVVANIKYNPAEGPDEVEVPFIVYPDGGVFMPRDWWGWLPDDAGEICEIEWVSAPDKTTAIMLDGLPRILV